MRFGEYLRETRDRRGWSQPVAAQQVGIEQSYLSKLETGKSYPSEEIFDKLQSTYGFDAGEVAGLIDGDELQKLKEVRSVRIAILDQNQTAQDSNRNWMLAGLTGLMIGGALLGGAIVPDTAERQYMYRSEGFLQPDESLTAYHAILSPDDGRHAEMLSRINQDNLHLDQYRGESFVETSSQGRRFYELIAHPETNSHSPLRFLIIPAFMLLFGSVGCFFIALQGRQKS